MNLTQTQVSALGIHKSKTDKHRTRLRSNLITEKFASRFGFPLFLFPLFCSVTKTWAPVAVRFN